jgi:hypothetical protein
MFPANQNVANSGRVERKTYLIVNSLKSRELELKVLRCKSLSQMQIFTTVKSTFCPLRRLMRHFPLAKAWHRQ